MSRCSTVRPIERDDVIWALKLAQDGELQITVPGFAERLRRRDPSVSVKRAETVITELEGEGLIAHGDPQPNSPAASTDQPVWYLTDAGFDA
jgi:hypothetical protein